MVVPEGLEPPTPTLGKWRSIRLSYGTGRARNSCVLNMGQGWGRGRNVMLPARR